jgi:hypothetical protein
VISAVFSSAPVKTTNPYGTTSVSIATGEVRVADSGSFQCLHKHRLFLLTYTAGGIDCIDQMLQDLCPALSGRDAIHSDSFILQKQVIARILKINSGFDATGILLPCSKECGSEHYLVLNESNEKITSTPH